MLLCVVIFKMSAQITTCTIVKTDCTENEYIMGSDARIYYSESELFLYHDGETDIFPLSEIRKMYFSTASDVNEIEKQQVRIYPNPAYNVLHISNIIGQQDVTIFSIKGEMMIKTNVSGESDIDISHFPSGMYVISTSNFVSKFIKF